VSVLQGKATTREWDLARPDARKLDVPARLGDDDPRCGAASLQKFAGEDLTVSPGVAAGTGDLDPAQPALQDWVLQCSGDCAACRPCF